jgi:UDP-N-acetylmuramate dehydrogenase
VNLNKPLEYPSCGSVFPKTTGSTLQEKLIQDSNLQGYRIGGVEVFYKNMPALWLM